MSSFYYINSSIDVECTDTILRLEVNVNMFINMKIQPPSI
jgi:hypothetical protein